MTDPNMTADHSIEFYRDPDGWDIARCECGWESPPCPGEEEAADFWGGHVATEEVGP